MIDEKRKRELIRRHKRRKLLLADMNDVERSVINSMVYRKLLKPRVYYPLYETDDTYPALREYAENKRKERKRKLKTAIRMAAQLIFFFALGCLFRFLLN